MSCLQAGALNLLRCTQAQSLDSNTSDCTSGFLLTHQIYLWGYRFSWSWWQYQRRHSDWRNSYMTDMTWYGLVWDRIINQPRLVTSKSTASYRFHWDISSMKHDCENGSMTTEPSINAIRTCSAATTYLDHLSSKHMQDSMLISSEASPCVRFTILRSFTQLLPSELIITGYASVPIYHTCSAQSERKDTATYVEAAGRLW